MKLASAGEVGRGRDSLANPPCSRIAHFGKCRAPVSSPMQRVRTRAVGISQATPLKNTAMTNASRSIPSIRG